MRAIRLSLVLLVGCGARTPLADEDASVTLVDAARPDRPAPVDLGAPIIDVGVDRPVVDVGVDRPAVDLGAPVDRPSFCGDGVLGGGEECDFGADNGPTDAFTLSQPGRPTVVVRPLVSIVVPLFAPGTSEPSRLQMNGCRFTSPRVPASFT